MTVECGRVKDHFNPGQTADQTRNVDVVIMFEKSLWQHTENIDVAAMFDESLWIDDTKRLTEVADALNEMGVASGAKGQPDRALGLHEGSLLIKKAIYGTEEHVSVATTLNNMAGIYADKDELDRALELYEQSLRIKKAVYDTEEHASVAITLYNMSLAFEKRRRVGDRAKALEYAQKSLDVLRCVLPEWHEDVIDAKQQVADLSN